MKFSDYVTSSAFVIAAVLVVPIRSRSSSIIPWAAFPTRGQQQAHISFVQEQYQQQQQQQQQQQRRRRRRSSSIGSHCHALGFRRHSAAAAAALGRGSSYYDSSSSFIFFHSPRHVHRSCEDMTPKTSQGQPGRGNSLLLHHQTSFRNCKTLRTWYQKPSEDERRTTRRRFPPLYQHQQQQQQQQQQQRAASEDEKDLCTVNSNTVIKDARVFDSAQIVENDTSSKSPTIVVVEERQKSKEQKQDIVLHSAETHGRMEPNPNTNESITALQSILLLNLVAIIWGTQHSVIKMVVDDCDAASFSFARFALASAIASPFLPNLSSLLNLFQNKSSENADHDPNMIAWKWGIEMGLWMFLGYAFQAVGLEYTTAQRSGFLLYLNVKFVPFFARILFGREISYPTWISAFTALAGTALLSYDGSSMALNVGDLWSVAAAAASAMFILRLESATTAVENSAALNATSLWMVTWTAFLWCMGIALQGEWQALSSSSGSSSVSSSGSVLWDWMTIASTAWQSTFSNVGHTIMSHPLELIYLGGVTTALANYIQTKAQKGISAERASIIYALDPVYGAFFAFLLLGEDLSSYGMLGAALITIAAATNAFLDLGPKENNASGYNE